LDEIQKDLRINRTFGKKYGLDAFREGELRLLRVREEKRFNLAVSFVKDPPSH